jgi:hypothetical protein
MLAVAAAAVVRPRWARALAALRAAALRAAALRAVAWVAALWVVAQAVAALRVAVVVAVVAAATAAAAPQKTPRRPAAVATPLQVLDLTAAKDRRLAQPMRLPFGARSVQAFKIFLVCSSHHLGLILFVLRDRSCSGPPCRGPPCRVDPPPESLQRPYRGPPIQARASSSNAQEECGCDQKHRSQSKCRLHVHD